MDLDGLVIRPNIKNKFRSSVGRQILKEVLDDMLATETFDVTTIERVRKSVGEAVRSRLKELNLPRYKYIVQVNIGEQRGQGIRTSCACMWDGDTDSLAQFVYKNQFLFCEVIIFAVFHY